MRSSHPGLPTCSPCRPLVCGDLKCKSCTIVKSNGMYKSPGFLLGRGTGINPVERHLSYPACPNSCHLKDSEPTKSHKKQK